MAHSCDARPNINMHPPNIKSGSKTWSPMGTEYSPSLPPMSHTAFANPPKPLSSPGARVWWRFRLQRPPPRRKILILHDPPGTKNPSPDPPSPRRRPLPPQPEAHCPPMPPRLTPNMFGVPPLGGGVLLARTARPSDGAPAFRPPSFRVLRAGSWRSRATFRSQRTRPGKWPTTGHSRPSNNRAHRSDRPLATLPVSLDRARTLTSSNVSVIF